MTRNYPRLSIEEFGAQLLTSGDLDPIYVALSDAEEAGQMDRNKVCRWMIAYWCFYHAGVASWLSEHEDEDFWYHMGRAAANNPASSPLGGQWPRGKERRHFRAANAAWAILDLAGRYPHPESMISVCYDPIAGNVLDNVQIHTGFGPWIAWKVADMLERVLGMPINFEGFNLSMYKDPTAAAIMLCEQKNWPLHVNSATAYLENYFKDFTAPPRHDRKVNIQEVETILCKWKSHVKGFYPLNNDIHEIRHGLTPWSKECFTAWNFHHFLPDATN